MPLINLYLQDKEGKVFASSPNVDKKKGHLEARGLAQLAKEVNYPKPYLKIEMQIEPFNTMIVKLPTEKKTQNFYRWFNRKLIKVG